MISWAGRAPIAIVMVLGLVAEMAPVNFAQGRPMIIATSGDAETMEPVRTGVGTTESIQRHMLEPLMANDPDGKIIPVLATSWRAIDNWTWEFKLRSGVRFQNGEPFTLEITFK